MSRDRSVTFVSTALTFGGAEQQVAALATRFAGRGWRTRVATMVTPDAHLEALGAAGVEVHSLDMRPGLPDPRAVIRLTRWLRDWRPDVVHSHMLHANLLARATRPLAPVPVLLSTAHNTYEGRGRTGERGWPELAYRLTDRLGDLTTNVSRVAVDRYISARAAPRDRIRWVPNGIDTTVFRPNPEARAQLRTDLALDGCLVFLAVGRFDPQKNHTLMLRAFAQLAHDHPAPVLLLAGRGPLEDEARLEAARLGLGDRVRFLGIRTDVPDLMAAADAYVMSSSWEGLPIVLLEASAVGLPIVATDVGGNAEVVEDQSTGLLVPAERPDALAAAVAQLAAMSPEERTRFGARGRARTEQDYGIEHVVDVWERIYDDLLERSGGRRRRWGHRGPYEGYSPGGRS